MPRENFKKTDEELSQAWNETADTEVSEGGNYWTPPPGSHVAKVDSAYLNRSQNGKGRPQLCLKFMFMEGEEEGKTAMAFYGLDNDKGREIAKRQLMNAGYTMTAGNTAVLDEISKEKPEVQVMVKVNGEFTNIYVNKRLSEVEEKDLVEEKKPAPAKNDDEVQVGQTVKCYEGKDVVGRGKIVKVSDTEEEVDVKLASGKVCKFQIDDIAIIG